MLKPSIYLLNIMLPMWSEKQWINVLWGEYLCVTELPFCSQARMLTSLINNFIWHWFNNRHLSNGAKDFSASFVFLFFSHCRYGWLFFSDLFLSPPSSSELSTGTKHLIHITEFDLFSWMSMGVLPLTWIPIQVDT